jgi:hypothetical protein
MELLERERLIKLVSVDKGLISAMELLERERLIKLVSVDKGLISAI